MLRDLHYDPHQRKEAVPIPYQVQGVKLEAVRSTKYLGATISDNLSWKAHNAIVLPLLVKLTA